MPEIDLKGTVLDGRYQVIEPIAEGAMGSVWRGERLKLGRAVAIKIMHQELPDELASRQRFEREAKLMALLEHPNCVSVIDFGVHEDKPFLVMDLVRGTSLIEILDKQGNLDVAKSCDIIRQVLSGLAHAHERGIVHRDIKPANIMITEKAGLGQQVRILDFGLARMQEATGTKLTTGIVVGTPNYMAPEQCKGGDIDARTDVYACGVVLFEMLTGRKPFIADDPIQVVRKHLLEKAPTMASLTNTDFGELEAVVAKALAKSPNDRFASAVDMAKAVEAASSNATKASAAALYSRAVPAGAPTLGNQQATMSGWNVPQGGQSAAPPQSYPPPPEGYPPPPEGYPPPPQGYPPPPQGYPPPPQGYPPPPVASPSSPVAAPSPPIAAVGAPPPPVAAPPPPASAPPRMPTPAAGARAVPAARGATPAAGARAVPPPRGATPAAGSPAALPPRGATPAAGSSAALPPRGATPAVGAPVAPGEAHSATMHIDMSDSAVLPESGVMAVTDSAILPQSAVTPAYDATTIDPPPLSGADTHRDSDPPGASLPPPLPKSATGQSPAIADTSSSSGAPDRSMGVPPTRPTGMPASDRPISKLPLTKKQLIIGGGALAVLLVVIVIVMSGGSKKTTPAKPGSGSTIVDDEPKADPVPQVIERANAQIASEDYDDAVATLKRARKAYPDNAQLAFLSGKANFGRLWWSDGVADFRDAIKIDDSYKENQELLKIVLKGFLTTPDVDDRIVSFMREIGPPMRPLLEETAEKHPKKALRARARAELNARP